MTAYRMVASKVYRSSNPGLAVRVYFMIYHLSAEEHKYLSGQRREKDAFERLIKERGVCPCILDRPANQLIVNRSLTQSMIIPIYDDTRTDSSEKVVTVSTRVGGGQKAVVAEPPRVSTDRML